MTGFELGSDFGGNDGPVRRHLPGYHNLSEAFPAIPPALGTNSYAGYTAA
jgi:hypothetical protein